MMNSEFNHPPGFWKTVRLLLGATRKRARGRRTRQQQLLNQRKGTDWGGLGVVLGALMMAVLNGFAAGVVVTTVQSAQRAEVETHGRMVVRENFLTAVKELEDFPRRRLWRKAQDVPDFLYKSQARDIARETGGRTAEIEQRLREEVRAHGSADLISEEDAAPGLGGPMAWRTLPAMLGSLALMWWGVMLVLQGEGMEMDLQRRRHPMWEWLFSHPVPAGGVFLAEMLSPIAANPIYWSAPLFVGIVYGMVYGPGLGMLAALLIGIPVSLAAACLGKALEIGAVLRFSPRTRGAVIGLMGWMGYASMMLFFLGWYLVPKVVAGLGRLLNVFTVVPWPWLGLFLGQQRDGSFSFPAGIAVCWMVAGVTGAVAVWFSVWGARKGLAGNFGQAAGPVKKKPGTKFGREPLYRKEYLWFTRDRSALVQAILIPLTVAGLQLFNFRGILNDVQGSWNYLSGAAILFGTYFLWVLGPRSLASEGSALWMALTWPRGLESLLKAKAWLWSMISTAMVALVLAYAGYLFPQSMWKIALVGVGWFFFGRSMAEKSVTLVTVTSESGETQKVPAGRRWAAQLGMLTFSIGVLMQQWHLAVIGIVYSYITSAAMWENFRARLPYLYDPWSEELPKPPTLMHAMIAISIMVDAGAVLTGMLAFLLGRENIAQAQAIAYALCAVGVSMGMAWFLGERGVSERDVWRWPTVNEENERNQPWWRDVIGGKGKLAQLLLVGAAGGLGLGLVAHGYTAVLEHIPSIAEIMRKSHEQMAEVPGARVFLGIMAVGFAPFAEEYLFRGLLFRALDREWGGWRAIVGSAAFFCIYHPPLAWLPVGLLGVANAVIFKKTGRLLPTVLLHMVYNAAVMW